jgi:hypothetical protein
LLDQRDHHRGGWSSWPWVNDEVAWWSVLLLLVRSCAVLRWLLANALPLLFRYARCASLRCAALLCAALLPTRAPHTKQFF